MALEISYAPQFFDSLEAIPEIGRHTDTQGVRIIFVERFGIDYQIRDKEVLIINIYSCQTDPEERYFKEQ